MLTRVFQIPIPPSVDSMYRNVPGRGRVKTAKYNEWSAQTALALALQKAGPMTPPVAITVTIYGGKGFMPSSDVGNRFKAPEDALVAAGVITDDNVRIVQRVCAVYVPPGSPKDVASATVTVEEIRAAAVERTEERS